MPEDDTLNAAPAQADTASDQAVQTEQVVTETTTETGPAATDTPDLQLDKLWANKYKAPEVMEEAHLDLQRRFTLETQRRAELERQLSKPAADPATPKAYTPEQLEGAKIDLLDKMAEARSNGDSTKAREYASQIVWCDRELMNQRVSQTQTHARSMAAEQRLMQELGGVVQQYTPDLVPGNPMYTKAAMFLNDFVANGATDNAVTQGLAVLAAAQLLGKTQGNVEQDTRRTLTKNIAGAMKGAVVAGAGQASNGAPANPDFMKMTDTEFETYQKQHGLR